MLLQIKTLPLTAQHTIMWNQLYLVALYRVKLPVKGYVNVFCEMVIDGGGWTVNDFKNVYVMFV